MNLLIISSLLALTTAADWSYHGSSKGPDQWASISDQCGGQKQSPINIEIAKVVYDSTLGEISMNGYDSPPSTMMIKNNKHSVKVSVTGSVSISGGGLGATYNLAQFHLHWGSTATMGSEHTLDAKAYPAEIHFVHYNSQYNSTSDALSQPGGLAVLGFFLQGGGSTHAGFQKVLDELPNIKFADEEVSMTPFAMTDIISANLAKFIRYQGSLTTPTCDETVTWTVFPDPIVVSDAQLIALRTGVYEDTDPGMSNNTTTGSPFTVISDNYRPVQKLNGRAVTSSMQMTAAASFCSVSHISLALLLVILVVL